jgi:alpha-beta hydrolase superfamily lysophospholipase
MNKRPALLLAPPALAALMALVSCAQAPTAAPAPRAAVATSAPFASPVACPAAVGPAVRCYAGRDTWGAHVWFAMPERWNGTLVLHAHGGPELGAPSSERTAEDLARWAVFPRSGYAWAASSFHQGGVAVRSAAEDTERAHQLFVAQFGAPGFTLLHGQSWGASVAARAAETSTATAGGKPPYDAVLLTSGVLGGGTLSYDFRLDLRVVWQAVCANHPKADEAAYPLWQGLPPGSALTRPELARRVDECTGVRLKREQRSPAQQCRLDTILAAVKIPERSLAAHLNWGTWHFQDIVFKRLDGRNPFGNLGVRYPGTLDDGTPLDARVARYAADPQATAAFGADTDPQGRIAVPVLAMHAIDDPTAFVELESTFRDTMTRAGTAEHLVQVFTADTEHSYLSDAQYLGAADALIAWARGGAKPTPALVAQRCAAHEARPGTECRIRPDYRPAPLSTRVPAR